MEMEYKDHRRRSRILVILGLIMAVVAGGSAFYLINQAQLQAGTGSTATTPIVVAVRLIPARKAIEAGDVAIRDVPIDPTNANGVFVSVDKVVGLIPGVNILEGQPIYANFLASAALGGQFQILAPGETLAPDSPSWRAVSMTIPDDRAVGGAIEPGDHVDIFVSAIVQVPVELAEAGKYYTDKATKIIYQDVTILAKTEQAYVVKVSLEVAEEISHIQATGQSQFSAALRPVEDTRPVDASKFGETTNLILQHYGLPIPQTWPPGKGVVPTPTPAASPAPSASPTPSPSP
jgi:Flp pilus assembly protein CpaB